MAVAALKGGVASGAFSLCVVGCLLGAVVWAWLAGHGPWAVSWLPWFLPLRGDPNLASALVAQTVKSMPAMQEMEVWCLGWKEPLEEEMATHSSILVGKSHGQRSLAGYSLWSHNSDTTEHMTVSRSMLQMALFHVLQLSNIPLYTHTHAHTHTHTHQDVSFLFSVQFSCSVMSDSLRPWTAALQASLSITNSQGLLKLMSIESVIPSSHLIILCRPLLLPPSIFPSIRGFSNESPLWIMWPKYWSFSFRIIIPMNFQDWSPLGWTGWISLQSKGLSRVVFSNTTVQKHQFFSAQLSL